MSQPKDKKTATFRERCDAVRMEAVTTEKQEGQSRAEAREVERQYNKERQR